MENYDHSDKELAIYKGYFLIEQNKNKEALKHFKALVGIYPADSNVLLGLAIAYSTVEQILKAIKTTEKALSFDPYNVEAYTFLCEIYSIKGLDYIKAETNGFKALELSPEDPYLHALMAQLYFHRNMQSQCHHFAVKALDINPENELAHMVLGLYYENKKNYTKAKEHYYKSLELAPNDPITIANLALLNINLAKTAEGYELMKDAIRVAPENKVLQDTFKEAYIQNHKAYRPITWLNKGNNHWIYVVPVIIICGAVSGTFCAAYPILFVIVSYIYYCRYRIGQKFDKAYQNGTLRDIM